MRFAVPACDRRAAIGRIRPILAALALLAGCAEPRVDAEACRRSANPEVCLDGGDGGIPPDRVEDGGGADAGFGGFSDAAPPSGDAGAIPGFSSETQAGDAACFNGVDDDLANGLDCQDPDCGATAYCCVGSTHPACCQGAGYDQRLVFRNCAQLPEDCGSLPANTFGAPLVEADGMVPYGDDLSDSGLVLGAPVDVRRERVALSARIGATRAACVMPSCLDVVALGLGESPSGPPFRVRPDVAVYVRSSRGDYALVVGGEVVDAEPLPDDRPHSYELTVSPDGVVQLDVSGARSMRAQVFLRADLVPMVWGRTFQLDGAEVPAYVAEATVLTQGCDAPAGLSRGVAPEVPFAGPAWRGAARSPSVIADGSDRLMAFVYEGAIHLARDEGSGWVLAGTGDLGAPALAVGVNESLDDPALVRGASAYALYFTRTDASGGRTIVRAEGDPGFAESFDTPVPLELPADRELTSPAVLVEGATVYLAAVARSGDEEVIVLLTATDPAGPFTYAAGSFDRSVVVRRGQELAHPARDEVGGPALFRGSRGLLRLYYAGRRGTRWSIAGRVSGGVLDTWRDAGEGPILVAAGGGFDALSVRDPSVLLEGDALTLFYGASDGVRSVIAAAEGVAP